MYFETKNGPVWEPSNQMLKSFYKVLEKNAPVLDGSRVFDDLIEAYEALEADLKEEVLS